MEKVPTGFDAGLSDRPPNLPPLNDVLAELNIRISTGEITFAEAEEALKDYGQAQE